MFGGMNAAVITEVKKPVVFQQVPEPVAAPGRAIIRLKAAALNHRDLWIQLGLYAGIKLPVIPGSDGAGVVESVGDSGDSDRHGDSRFKFSVLSDNPSQFAVRRSVIQQHARSQ